jgi:hypothetical protein
MVHLAFIPQMFDDPSEHISNHLKLSRNEFKWVRGDAVVCPELKDTQGGRRHETKSFIL